MAYLKTQSLIPIEAYIPSEGVIWHYYESYISKLVSLPALFWTENLIAVEEGRAGKGEGREGSEIQTKGRG